MTALQHLRSILRGFSDERGVTAPVIAIAMTVLVASTSLAIDGGLLYRAHRQVQNVADAAALAGAHDLPEDPEQAIVTATNYVLENGLTEDDIEDIAVVSIFNEDDGVEVRLRHTLPLLFAPVFGLSEQAMRARAVGLVAPIEPYDIWPWGVTQESLIYDENIALKVGSRNNVNGNFMALAFPGSSGANRYRDAIRNGFNGSIPGPVPPATMATETETGNMAQPTVSSVNYLMGRPACEGEWADVRCPRIGLVPVLSAGTWNDVRGRSSVEIIGFAVFELQGVTAGPTGQQEVEGRFLEYAYGVGRSSWVGGPLEGLLGVRLWQ